MFAIWTFVVLFCTFRLSASNKYSKELNKPDYERLISLDKPYRMQKLNLVWEKAVKKLSPEKLKILYSDLKYQDKEELFWKKLKAEGLDKEGLKEALIRGSFNAILEKYQLVYDFKALQEANSPKMNENQYSNESYVKSVFRDKKLNKLWLKAEQQGFTAEQMQALKEEFEHHQNKIDQYYQVLNNVNKESWSKDDLSNTIENVLQAEEGEKMFKTENPHQALKEKHAQLKAGYDHLNEKVIPSLKNMEFEEPQVNSLWEMAKNTSFSVEELDSLRRELHHFEHRIRKLKTLASLEMVQDEDENMVNESTIKRKRKIKEYNYKVEKIHAEIAGRILQKHSEL